MKLGSSLYNARKKSGLSQEDVAGKLGVSRQTISKWETDETLPDIRQAKRLAVLYHLSLDELIEFDAEVDEIRSVIANTSEKTQQKIAGTGMPSALSAAGRSFRRARSSGAARAQARADRVGRTDWLHYADLQSFAPGTGRYLRRLCAVGRRNGCRRGGSGGGARAGAQISDRAPA